jgi:hypothetical protein
VADATRRGCTGHLAGDKDGEVGGATDTAAFE